MDDPRKNEKDLKTAEGREWFVEWFDSPYYHILYKNRDEREAHTFIDQLLEYLAPAPDARVLDLACGKGRYSRYLAAKGFDVTGLDLSVASIRYARQFETDRLSFYTHDMRLPFRINYFDFIFNFFTSFGYFDNEKDHISTLKNVAGGLRPGGIFVLDFFNSRYVTDHLLGQEEKTIEGIDFAIEKKVVGDYVVKTIYFSDQGRDYFFRERVRLFLPADFQRLFARSGLRILKTFGDYQLRDFDLLASPRLILVAQPV